MDFHKWSRVGTFNIAKSLKRITPTHEKLLVNNFDVLCLTEIGVWSLTDFLERIGRPLREGFKWFVKPRSGITKRTRSPSGGVAIGIKHDIAHDAVVVKTNVELNGVLVVRLSKYSIGTNQDICIFGVDVPPSTGTTFVDHRVNATVVWKGLTAENVE